MLKEKKIKDIISTTKTFMQASSIYLHTNNYITKQKKKLCYERIVIKVQKREVIYNLAIKKNVKA